MDAVGHAIGLEAVEQPVAQLGRGEPDIHVDGLGALIEPLEMLLEERNAAIVHSAAPPTPRRPG